MIQLRNSSLIKIENEAYPSTLKQNKKKRKPEKCQNLRQKKTKQNRMDDKNIMWLLCRELYITVDHWCKKEGGNPRLSKKKWMLTGTRPSLRFLQLQVPTQCKEAAPGGTCTLVSVLMAWLPSGLSIQNTREQGSSGPHTLGLDCSPGSGGSAKTTEMPCVGPSFLTSKIRPSPASHTSLLETTVFDIFLSAKVKKQSMQT